MNDSSSFIISVATATMVRRLLNYLAFDVSLSPEIVYCSKYTHMHSAATYGSIHAMLA